MEAGIFELRYAKQISMQQKPVDVSSDPSQHTAFYERLADGRFSATRATESPWSDSAQHGGPPLALAAFALGEAFPATDLRINRITLDFLGEIPRDSLAVTGAIERPGKRIELLSADLSHNGRRVALVKMWRSRHQHDRPDVPIGIERPGNIPPPQGQQSFQSARPDWGYAQAVDLRFVYGGFEQGDAASAWMRPRVPLVAGVSPDPYSAALIVADSANGISSPLRLDEWLFVPVSITVGFLRDPAGEWMNLTAQTAIGPDGRGITTAWLFDTSGAFAQVTQSLYIAKR